MRIGNLVVLVPFSAKVFSREEKEEKKITTRTPPQNGEETEDKIYKGNVGRTSHRARTSWVCFSKASCAFSHCASERGVGQSLSWRRSVGRRKL